MKNKSITSRIGQSLFLGIASLALASCTTPLGGDTSSTSCTRGSCACNSSKGDSKACTKSNCACEKNIGNTCGCAKTEKKKQCSERK